MDESLIETGGAVNIKQYNPMKTRTCRFRIYSHHDLLYWKPQNFEESMWYIGTVSEEVNCLVDDLECSVDVSGRNISMDRYYSSIKTAF